MKTTDKILTQLENLGYKILIKKHLRENLSKSLCGYDDRYYLNEAIPLELYDLKNIKIAIGVSSAAIGKVADSYPGIKCISTAKLIMDKKNSKRIMTELNLISPKNQLYFIDKISDLLRYA